MLVGEGRGRLTAWVAINITSCSICCTTHFPTRGRKEQAWAKELWEGQEGKRRPVTAWHGKPSALHSGSAFCLQRRGRVNVRQRTALAFPRTIWRRYSWTRMPLRFCCLTRARCRCNVRHAGCTLAQPQRGAAFQLCLPNHHFLCSTGDSPTVVHRSNARGASSRFASPCQRLAVYLPVALFQPPTSVSGNRCGEERQTRAAVDGASEHSSLSQYCKETPSLFAFCHAYIPPLLLRVVNHLPTAFCARAISSSRIGGTAYVSRSDNMLQARPVQRGAPPSPAKHHQHARTRVCGGGGNVWLWRNILLL